MNSPHDDLFPRPDDALDRVVRRNLDEDADPQAADALWKKAKERARQPRPWLAWMMRGAAVAAVLLIGVLLVMGGPAQATPAQLVERARVAHDAPISREYTLAADLPDSFVKRWPTFRNHRETTLWTRGDCFRVEPGLAGGVWGQDEKGNVWVAPSPKAGAIFRPNEIPSAFRDVLNVRSARLPALLGEVLKNCDLERAPDPRPGTIRLQASGKGRLRRATIDIGPGDVVQRLVLVLRLLSGEEFTLTLTLQQEAEKPASFYELAGNLGPDGKQFGRGQRLKRLGLLARHHLDALLHRK
jgi:hypothetical protein